MSEWPALIQNLTPGVVPAVVTVAALAALAGRRVLAILIVFFVGALWPSRQDFSNTTIQALTKKKR